MNTFVYIDGFNLYYGAVKGTPYKWLDIHRLCQLLLPKNRILKIKYFKALVTTRPGDPDQPAIALCRVGWDRGFLLPATWPTSAVGYRLRACAWLNGSLIKTCTLG